MSPPLLITPEQKSLSSRSWPPADVRNPPNNIQDMKPNMSVFLFSSLALPLVSASFLLLPAPALSHLGFSMPASLNPAVLGSAACNPTPTRCTLASRTAECTNYWQVMVKKKRRVIRSPPTRSDIQDLILVTFNRSADRFTKCLVFQLKLGTFLYGAWVESPST